MTQEKKNMILKGAVVSDKMDKTIVVAVDTFKTHGKYLKKFISTKKYKVHDPENQYKVGDVVKIMGGRPISKDKKFIIVK